MRTGNWNCSYGNTNDYRPEEETAVLRTRVVKIEAWDFSGESKTSENWEGDISGEERDSKGVNRRRGSEVMRRES